MEVAVEEVQGLARVADTLLARAQGAEVLRRLGRDVRVEPVVRRRKERVATRATEREQTRVGLTAAARSPSPQPKPFSSTHVISMRPAALPPIVTSAERRCVWRCEWWCVRCAAGHREVQGTAARGQHRARRTHRRKRWGWAFWIACWRSALVNGGVRGELAGAGSGGRDPGRPSAAMWHARRAGSTYTLVHYPPNHANAMHNPPHAHCSSLLPQLEHPG